MKMSESAGVRKVRARTRTPDRVRRRYHPYVSSVPEDGEGPATRRTSCPSFRPSVGGRKPNHIPMMLGNTIFPCNEMTYMARERIKDILKHGTSPTTAEDDQSDHLDSEAQKPDTRHKLSPKSSKNNERDRSVPGRGLGLEFLDNYKPAGADADTGSDSDSDSDVPPRSPPPISHILPSYLIPAHPEGAYADRSVPRPPLSPTAVIPSTRQRRKKHAKPEPAPASPTARRATPQRPLPMSPRTHSAYRSKSDTSAKWEKYISKAKNANPSAPMFTPAPRKRSATAAEWQAVIKKTKGVNPLRFLRLKTRQ
jgi:hypothetical protein